MTDVESGELPKPNALLHDNGEEQDRRSAGSEERRRERAEYVPPKNYDRLQRDRAAREERPSGRPAETERREPRRITKRFERESDGHGAWSGRAPAARFSGHVAAVEERSRDRTASRSPPRHRARTNDAARDLTFVYNTVHAAYDLVRQNGDRACATTLETALNVLYDVLGKI